MQAFLKDTSPFVTLAQQVAPWITQLVELAAIFGIFSCFLAIHNTTVRVMFSMGRDKVLPTSLGAVHPRWFSPDRAIYAQTAFTVIIGLAVGAWLGPGATGAYGFTGAIGTVAIVIVYILSNIALIRYFWRRNDRKVFTHIVVPILGVIALAYPLYAVSTPGQAWPYNLVPFVVLAWIVAGVILFLRYRAKSPEKIAALGSFIAEDDVPLEDQPESLLAARAPSLQHPTVKEEIQHNTEEEER
jgi:amino acid transporter